MAVHASEEEQLFRGYAGRMLLLITFTLVAIRIGRGLLPPLLPLIIDDLGITAFRAGIALSTLMVVRAVLQYPSGRYSDQLSRASLLAIAMALGIFGFFLLAITPTYLMFLLGAVVFGGSIGLFEPAARALISDLFQEKRGRAFGFHMLAADTAGILAAGMAIVVAALVWRAAFVPSIGGLIVALVLLALWNREFVALRWIELDLTATVKRLFESSHLRWASLGYSFAVFSSVGLNSFLPSFLIAAHDFSIELASGSFALLYGVGIIAKPASGWLSDHVPRLAVVGGAMTIAAISVLALVFAQTPATVVAGVIGYAVGQRSFAPAFQAHLMDMFPGDSMGGDLGAVRTVYLVFGSLGPTYVGYVSSQVSYSAAFTSLAVGFSSTAAVTLWLMRSG